MAKRAYSRCAIETMEGRTMFSTAPIFGQYPMILVPNYQTPKPDSDAGMPPPVTSPVVPPVPMPLLPPVSTPAPTQPVQPDQLTLAEAPDDLRARASRHAKAVCLKWDSVAPSAKTIVIEASTDGEDFTTIGLLDADDRKFRATNLDKTETYTFRVFTLDENDTASAVAEITPKWKC